MKNNIYISTLKTNIVKENSGIEFTLKIQMKLFINLISKQKNNILKEIKHNNLMSKKRVAL